MTDSVNKCPACDRPYWHGHEDGCPEAEPKQSAEPDPDQTALALLDIDRRDRARGIT